MVDPRVSRTIEVIDEQLHRPLTVAELARIAGLSVVHFTRLFRRATGQTPALFIRERRLERARILIERTSLSVSEVMAQVGIADRSHFARVFRNLHGLGPRSLRMRVRDPRTGRIAG
jgi:AraC family transcriptional regulator